MSDPKVLLYQALSSPLGLVIYVSDFTLARARLYSAKRSDPALARLQLRACPGKENELWIIKGQEPSTTTNERLEQIPVIGEFSLEDLDPKL